MSDLSGKTVIITGASRGIGEATAHAFAAAGANLALLARSGGAIETIAADVGSQALAIRTDVSDWESVSAAISTAAERFGSIDVLIGNAGALEPIARMEHSDPAAWSAIIDINLKGVFYGMRAVLPHMRAQGGGTIITISSGAAHGPMEGWSHYCASKAGAYMLTRCLDAEERAHGIRALGLSPGTVATQMQRDIKASGINPVSRLNWDDHVPPEWPARALIWMCSADADTFLGDDVRLRDGDVLRRAGLINEHGAR